MEEILTKDITTKTDNKKNKSVRRRKKQTRAQAWGDIIYFLIKIGVVILSGWIIFGLVFGVTVVTGEDMYPRIRDGDLMIYYRLQKEYHIEDVVTFTNEDNRYTGRIVAQGGDIVNISENGELIVNGSVQSESVYYPTEVVDGGVTFPYEVPTGNVFLLCDFRTNAIDSRTYGAVEIDELDGKVITILRRRGI